MSKLAAPAVIMMKDCQLTIGADGADAIAGTDDDFAAHATQVLFTPPSATAPVTWSGLSPDSEVTDSPTSTAGWTCAIAYGQDWTSAKSLSRTLHERAGQVVPVVFQPKAGSGLPAITAKITLQPGPIGGTKNQHTVGTVTCGVSGKPVLGTAA